MPPFRQSDFWLPLASGSVSLAGNPLEIIRDRLLSLGPASPAQRQQVRAYGLSDWSKYAADRFWSHLNISLDDQLEQPLFITFVTLGWASDGSILGLFLPLLLANSISGCSAACHREDDCNGDDVWPV
jgi:hypothetical protein